MELDVIGGSGGYRISPMMIRFDAIVKVIASGVTAGLPNAVRASTGLLSKQWQLGVAFYSSVVPTVVDVSFIELKLSLNYQKTKDQNETNQERAR